MRNDEHGMYDPLGDNVPGDDKPTEARQDELAEQMDEMLEQELDATFQSLLLHPMNMPTIKKIAKESLKGAFYSLTVSSGGGVCPRCKGEKEVQDYNSRACEYYMKSCPTCNGKGRTKGVEKTFGQLVEEFEDGTME